MKHRKQLDSEMSEYFQEFSLTPTARDPVIQVLKNHLEEMAIKIVDHPLTGAEADEKEFIRLKFLYEGARQLFGRFQDEVAASRTKKK